MGFLITQTFLTLKMHTNDKRILEMILSRQRDCVGNFQSTNHMRSKQCCLFFDKIMSAPFIHVSTLCGDECTKKHIILSGIWHDDFTTTQPSHVLLVYILRCSPFKLGLFYCTVIFFAANSNSCTQILCVCEHTLMFQAAKLYKLKQKLQISIWQNNRQSVVE